MRTLIYSIVFVAVISGAFLVVNNTSNKLDMPYEAGMFHAPDLGHGHGAAAGHGEASGHAAEAEPHS